MRPRFLYLIYNLANFGENRGRYQKRAQREPIGHAFIFFFVFLLGIVGTSPALGAVVLINGEPSSQTPLHWDGRLYLPVREAAEKLGADLQWDGRQRTFTVRGDWRTIVVQVDTSAITVDGNSYGGEYRVLLREDRAWVPLRFFSEVFGAPIRWYQEA